MANIYNNAKEGMIDGTLDFDVGGALLHCLLLRSDGVTPTYDPNHVTVADVLGHAQNTETAVGGYVRDTLTSVAVKVALDPTNEGQVEAAKAVFSGLATGEQVGAAVVYKGDVGTANDATTNIVVGFYNTANLPTNGGDIEIRFDGVDGVGDFVRLTGGSGVYNNAKEGLLDGRFDLGDGGATYRVLLLRADGGGPPVFDPDDVFVSDMLAPATSVELSTGGPAPYVRLALGSRATSQDDAANEGDADAQKSTFIGLATGQTIGAAVVFKFETNDADSPVIAFYELSDTSTNTGDVQILWDGVDGVGTFLKLTE